MVRSLVHYQMRCNKDRRLVPPLGAPTKGALAFAIFSALFLLFKHFEPSVYPVIDDFRITETHDRGESVAVFGSFDKRRDCSLTGVIGYSGKDTVSVVMARAPKASPANRLVRQQTFGPWVLIPKVNQLELYAEHECWTGTVKTKLFDGALVL